MATLVSVVNVIAETLPVECVRITGLVGCLTRSEKSRPRSFRLESLPTDLTHAHFVALAKTFLHVDAAGFEVWGPGRRPKRFRRDENGYIIDPRLAQIHVTNTCHLVVETMKKEVFERLKLMCPGSYTFSAPRID